MATSTLTLDQQQSISDWLVEHPVLSEGLGDDDSACSIAAINLALTGELTDRAPDCMSLVISRWIIFVQDAMPDELRNSGEWKELLPIAAGTGRAREHERSALVLDWLWDKVLPLLTPVAWHAYLEGEWGLMLEKRTSDAAREFVDNTPSAPPSIGGGYSDLVRIAGSAAEACDALYYGDYDSVPRLLLELSICLYEFVESSTWSTLDPVGTLRALIEA